MKVLCITPNPSIDHIYCVAELGVDRIHYAYDYRMSVGGKAINVARGLQALGHETLSLGFVAGNNGELFCKLAEKEGLRGLWTSVDGETRNCAHIVNPTTGQTTVVNGPGPQTKERDWAELSENVMSELAAYQFVCLGGTLPDSNSTQLFVKLIQNLIDSEKSVWLDCSGAVLREALSVKGVNIKINHLEAASLVEQAISDIPSAWHAAKTIHNKTNSSIFITMAEKGALMLTASRACFVEAPKVSLVSSSGSGDAFLAGLLDGLPVSEELALIQAVASGSANAASYGAGFSPEKYTQLLGQLKCIAVE
jgi:1-phosphofructokinase family hexose kinase